MRSKSLFSSLSGDYEGAPLVDQVSEHLNWLLNTWRGTCYHEPSYGVPHFQIFGEIPHADFRFARELVQTIQKYEPRLAGLKLDVLSRVEKSTSRPFFAYYVLHGSVGLGGERSDVDRELVVTLDGNVDWNV